MRRDISTSFFYIIILILLFLPMSCSEKEEGEFETYSVSLDKDLLAMSIGEVSCLDFYIAPNNRLFENNSAQSGLSVRLESSGSTPQNCRLEGFEPAKKDDGSIIPGKYHAFVKDLGIRTCYEEDLNLVICIEDDPAKVGGGKILTAPFVAKCVCDSLTQKVLDTGLIAIRIETVDGEEPTCDYVSPPSDGDGLSISNATKVPGRLLLMRDSFVLYDSGMYEKGKSGMTMKIRGNTSAYSDKKPFKIKLQKKADLLIRDNVDYQDKDWLLITDESLNAMVGFKVNELVGLQWTPHYQYVNLIVNGNYRGLYMLIEPVERNNICRLKVDDDGFIFEMDAYWWNEDVRVMSERFGGGYTFKYPDSDEITDNDISSFIKIIDEFEKSIVDGTYPDYIDVNSFVSWLLAQEILGNMDPGGSNIFLTKKNREKDTKIMMGCMWDFDNILRTRGWYCRQIEIGIFCFGYLWKDSNFKKEYIKRWKDLNSTIFDETSLFLDTFKTSDYADAINQSLTLDGKRWNVERDDVFSIIEFMKDWFVSRRVWLQGEIDSIEN